MKTTYLRNKILDHMLGGGDYTRPATVYLALFTAAPGIGGGGTEVAGGSYARVAVTNDATNWPAASAGQKSNGLALTYAQATASWGTVTHAALFDAATGGNMLHFTTLPSPRTVQNGDTPSWAVGSLVLTET
jgi:hypothetical protein